jgi:hypothetical protein
MDIPWAIPIEGMFVLREELQLTLQAFDANGAPLCNQNSSQNGFRKLCYHCPFSARGDGGRLECTRYQMTIGPWDKYALAGWKDLRARILQRDGSRCTLCGSEDHLHVHHIDQDRTNDLPENLVTLCEICHARVHREMKRDQGSLRMKALFKTYAANDV